jgi:hypothetical protein
MSISTQLITIFNKKIPEETKTPTVKYNELFLKKLPVVETKMYELPLYKSIDTPNCNYICRMKYFQDVTFVKKIMELRVYEIRKKLVYIKYHIELYKLLLIALKKEKNPKKLFLLNEEKTKLKQLLKSYVLKDNGNYILSITLSQYLFLKHQYKLFFGNNSPYFIYD